jgi:hypothetical protein
VTGLQDFPDYFKWAAIAKQIVIFKVFSISDLDTISREIVYLFQSVISKVSQIQKDNVPPV